MKKKTSSNAVPKIDESAAAQPPGETAPAVKAPVLNSEAFPIEALPPAARELVEDMSASFKIPVGLPAATLLGVASCAIGKGLMTRAYIDALVPANLYVIIGASTGAGKSLAFKPLMKPLLNVQRYAQLLSETHSCNDSPRRQDSFDWEDEEMGGGNLEFDRVVTGVVDLAELRSSEACTVASVGRKFYLGHRNYDPDRPQAPVLCSEDMTGPAMAYSLWENGETLSSVSADAFDLVGKLAGKSAEQYAAIQGFYLKCYSEDSIGVGRVARKVFLIEPNLSVLWLTQLKPLDMFVTNDQLRDSGLVARCLFGRFDFQKDPLSEEMGRVDQARLQQWNQLMLDVLDTYRFGEERFFVTCSPEAVACFRDYSNEVLALQQGRLVDVDTHLVRVAENAVRISLVLQALRHGREAHVHPISLETAQAAIQLSRWFMSQRLDLLVVKREQSREAEEAEVVRRLQGGSLEGQTARWFLQRRVAPSKSGVEAILNRMVAKGTLQTVSHRPRRGGHPVTLYTLPLGSVSRPGLPLGADEIETTA